MGNSHEKIDIIHRILRCHKASTTHTEPEMLRNPRHKSRDGHVRASNRNNFGFFIN